MDRRRASANARAVAASTRSVGQSTEQTELRSIVYLRQCARAPCAHEVATSREATAGSRWPQVTAVTAAAARNHVNLFSRFFASRLILIDGIWPYSIWKRLKRNTHLICRKYRFVFCDWILLNFSSLVLSSMSKYIYFILSVQKVWPSIATDFTRLKIKRIHMMTIMLEISSCKTNLKI